MIAANYTAHFYCDCAICEQAYRPESAEVVGESWTQVATAARKAGWRISQDRTRCYAPGHKIKRNTSDGEANGNE